MTRRPRRASCGGGAPGRPRPPGFFQGEKGQDVVAAQSSGSASERVSCGEDPPGVRALRLCALPAAAPGRAC